MCCSLWSSCCRSHPRPRSHRTRTRWTWTGSTVYHFTTAENGTVTDYASGEAPDPDYRVRTSEEAFFAVVNASDPSTEFDRQYEAGNVEIHGVGVTNSVKAEAVKAAVWVGKTFGLF